MNPLKCFLEPESIAIIGASRTPGRPGYVILEHLAKQGFHGEVYVVNPTADEILGFRAYKHIKDIPGDFGLALSLAPAHETPWIIEQCVTKGAQGIVICSGSFSESDEKGIRLERKVVETARRLGIRVMGPNALGPVNTSNNLILSFYPLRFLRKGGAAFIAQSGQFSSLILDYMCSSLGMGVSKSIDVGNGCDVDEADALDYLQADADTRVIGIYMEGIRDGRRFVEASGRVVRSKPVVVLKTGTTDAGARAARSHTGAMMVNNAVFDAALKQSGVTGVTDLEEFLDVVKAFEYLPAPRGKRIGVITYSGGIGAMVADACGEWGLDLPSFSEATARVIEAVLPSASVSNPFDCFSGVFPQDPNEVYRATLEALMNDANVDIVLSCYMLPREGGMWWTPDLNHVLSSVGDVKRKPIAFWLIGDGEAVRESTRLVEERGIPAFVSPERAVRAIGYLCRWHPRDPGV